MHGLPSSQAVSSGVCRQACSVTSHTSVVHAIPSPQSFGSPRQFPPEQASLTVQKLPSSQDPGIFVRVQAPVAGSQASAVQAFPSSQFTGVVRQVPVEGSQVSTVQGSPSSHIFARPLQTTDPASPVTHVSSDVQELESSQGVPGSSAPDAMQCPESSQASGPVQEFPSSQAVPSGSSFPTQPPVESQASPVVQGRPSSHAVPAALREWTHPPPAPGLCGSKRHESSVHAFPSSQLRASCLHVPVVVSQESTVQGLKSSHEGQSSAGAGLPCGAPGAVATMTTKETRPARMHAVVKRRCRLRSSFIGSVPPTLIGRLPG